MTTVCLQSVFNDYAIAGRLISRELWESTVLDWGANRAEVARGKCDLSLLKILQPVGIAATAALLSGTVWLSLRGRMPLRSAFGEWAFRGWCWWLLPGGWEILRVLSALAGWGFLHGMTLAILPMLLAVSAAGWAATFLTLAWPSIAVVQLEPNAAELNLRPSRRSVFLLTSMCVLYVVAFTWMNWQLYWGLHIPHGDSAMYEEHLWNVTHGKGFRSYLDDGRLFLGEHVQVIHLLLIPMHLIWPSQLLLELCESLALAGGAIPVFLLTRRHTGLDRWGLCLAAAYLLAFPLHFLDIAIDLKTFRPISFGVPLMLFAIDQLERRRYRTFVVLLVLTVSAKEDFAVIVSLLGIWMAVSHWRNARTDSIARREKRLGIGLAVCGAAYVLLVIKVVIPAFRGGDPHYTQYFGALGNTPGDIIQHVFTQPSVVLGKLFSGRSFYSALALLLPIGFLPLLSPGRLLVAVPLFGVLCLLEFSDSPVIPYHHFHAPLLPILFWSAAAGLGRVEKRWSRFVRMTRNGAAHFALTCAVFSAAVLSFYPGSLAFWDAGANGPQGTYWRARFVPGKRAELFPQVQALVPIEARVFCTDFIHPRFTHYRRSYDYSAYARKSDEELAQPVAGETYYIVIDTRSRYSKIRTPADVKEYRQHPENWERIRHAAEEFFIVLKRR